MGNRVFLHLVNEWTLNPRLPLCLLCDKKKVSITENSSELVVLEPGGCVGFLSSHSIILNPVEYPEIFLGEKLKLMFSAILSFDKQRKMNCSERYVFFFVSLKISHVWKGWFPENTRDRMNVTLLEKEHSQLFLWQ